MLKQLVRTWVRGSVRDRGMRGNSPFWLTVGAFSLLKRLYDGHARKTETIRLGEQLRPGDELIIRYPGTPGRKTRKEISAAQVLRDRKAAAKAQQAAKLEAKVERGGIGSRKARKRLAALWQSE